MEVIAIIPAGGKGLRSGLTIPKQFVKINGKELIAYTLQLFQKNKLINSIVVSAPQEYFPLLEHCRRKYGFSKLELIVKGGKERQHSVFNALSSRTFAPDDLIAVHDAARPLLTQVLLTESINYAKEHGNAVMAVKARDTLASGGNFIENYTDRDRIYYLQTPQIFRYSVLKKAFDKANDEKFIGTDESMLVKRTGEKVFIFNGSYQNIKITTLEDLKVFKKLTLIKKNSESKGK